MKKNLKKYFLKAEIEKEKHIYNERDDVGKENKRYRELKNRLNRRRWEVKKLK